MKPNTINPRVSEWILAAYFTYTSVLALVLTIDPAMRSRALLANALAVVLYVLLLRAVRRGRSEWPGVLRDVAPLGLALLAYKQMGWFAPSGHDYALERSWIVWDRMVLHQWGLRSAIESLGVVVPSVLDLSYLLVYAFPVFCMAMLYAYKRREQADTLLTMYLLGLCLAYVQFPFWPSEPPWTVFAGQDLPLVATLPRRINLSLLASQGIHTSVFPSAHVSGAFAAAFAIRGVFPDKPWLGWGTLVYAILVAVATVYGRYHYAADALAGFGVAVVAARLGALLLRRRIIRDSTLKPRFPDYAWIKCGAGKGD
jgi:membrane-associated phospholipid phosphatase